METLIRSTWYVFIFVENVVPTGSVVSSSAFPHLTAPFPAGLSASLAATAEGGVLQEDGAAGKSKAGLLKSLAVRAMSEAEYVSTGTLSQHQQTGGNGGKGDWSASSLPEAVLALLPAEDSLGVPMGKRRVGGWGQR